MGDRARVEFEKLTTLASTLDSNVCGLESQFSDMTSVLTLPPSEEDLREANQILESLTDYWKNMCEIESATVDMNKENASIKEHLDKAKTSLNECQEKKNKSVKYATEKLNVSLGKLHTPSDQELNKNGHGVSASNRPASSMQRSEAETRFLVPRRLGGLDLSPGDDNTDNTVMEFK